MSSREKESILVELISRHYKEQCSNPSIQWKKPDSNGISSLTAPNEVIIGGVYLRLFVENPAWTLRKPKEFLSELLETCLDNMSKDSPNVSPEGKLQKIDKTSVFSQKVMNETCILLPKH